VIHIDRLRMHLPAGFEHRATTLTRMVGDVLSKQSVSRDVSLDSISIAPQKVNVNTPDIEIAQMIVAQIISGNQGGQ
jgi:hypothetical protein